MEVTSPSTEKKDRYQKLYKYQNAGVREYWIIDPKSRTVLVYEFENGDRVSLYSFRDRIPIGILNGTGTVDFSLIDDYVTPFMPRD